MTARDKPNNIGTLQARNLNQGLQTEILQRIYALHGEWTDEMNLACTRGCAPCCTQSVTMTELEGRLITTYLQEQKRLNELTEILKSRQPSVYTTLTTNEFAEYCLRGLEPKEAIHQDWDFTPCPFLHKNCCTIYPARPFGCRAFISTVNCAKSGSAEVAPLVLTINTVYTQLIEQLAQGQLWGKMLDILECYQVKSGVHKSGATERHLRHAKPTPGLLVCEEEQEPVQAILERLGAEMISGQPIRALLGLEEVLW